MHNLSTVPRTRGLIKAAAFTAAEINQNTPPMFRITPDEARTMLSILRGHDAGSLAPEIPFKNREPVSRMFDKLRFNLREMAEKEVVSCR
jgi:hypothetical protein